MDEQPNFDNYNTLDYAVYRHDIERLEEVRFTDLNKRLNEGWALLHLATIYSQDGVFQESAVWAYMGIPRARHCQGAFSEFHERTQAVWDHVARVWVCPICHSNVHKDYRKD